jgi:hypothetical protein
MTEIEDYGSNLPSIRTLGRPNLTNLEDLVCAFRAFHI